MTGCAAPPGARSSWACGRRTSPTRRARVAGAGPVLETDCLIEVTEPTGPDLIAVVEMGGKEVLARLRPDAEARAGQRSRLVFDMGKAVVFDAGTEARIA